MSLQTTTLIDGQAIAAETAKEFSLDHHQLPATLSCNGVADSGEDIEIQKNVPDSNGDNWLTVSESGSDQVLNGTNTAVAIYAPGHYRILTADVAYASGDVTVVLDF